MKAESNHEKMAVVFPGQGSACLGLGLPLIKSFPEARQRLDQFSEITDTDLYQLHTCKADVFETGPIDTVKIHLAMVSYGLLAWELLIRINRFKPYIAAGHSLGEITALACAGVIKPEDALQLAKVRGQLIADAGREMPGGMTAFFGESVNEIRSQVTAWQKNARETGFDGEAIFEANINGPRQLVVSGSLDQLDALEKKLAGCGIGAVSLPVSGAFHSPFMNNAAAQFFKAAEKIKFKPAQLPVISAMTGRLVTNVRGLSTRLALQMVNPVQWFKVMKVLQKSGIELLIEAGPGKPVLCQLAKGVTSWEINTRSVPELLDKKNHPYSNIKKEGVS